jgi:hypothetical protein
MAPRLPTQTLKTRTTSLDVAALLLVRGFEICDVKLGGSAATFAFKDPNLNGATAAKNFYNGTQVPPNAYANAQKRPRDLIWEAQLWGVL